MVGDGGAKGRKGGCETGAKAFLSKTKVMGEVIVIRENLTRVWHESYGLALHVPHSS